MDALCHLIGWINHDCVAVFQTRGDIDLSAKVPTGTDRLQDE